MATALKTIIFATGNKDKMREIRQIFADLPYEILSMKEAGISVDIDENGTTYAENAMIKAEAVADKIHAMIKDEAAAGEIRTMIKAETGKVSETADMYTDAVVMADDSGFEVDFLDKAPGVYSARYMGEDTSYDIKNASILKKLEGVPDEKRTARFMCAIAMVFPNGDKKVTEAAYEGRVAYEAKGTNGFGYDPIFYVPEYGKTDAELPPEVKNEIGHRGKALRAAAKILKDRENQ